MKISTQDEEDPTYEIIEEVIDLCKRKEKLSYNVI